jgi:hypothetical protein
MGVDLLLLEEGGPRRQRSILVELEEQEKVVICLMF